MGMHSIAYWLFFLKTYPRNRGGFRRTRVAIVQCAVSVAVSSSTGASSGTAAAVVVVSSHSIRSGLRVIARASTSSMRETGTMSRPFLMLSLISTRSLAFSSGMSTVLMPPRKAASSFSLRPAIGHTRPRSVISPVMATSRRTRMPVITETVAVAKQGRLDAEGDRAHAYVRRRRRDRFLHHVAQVAGDDHLTLAWHHGGFNGEQLAADVGPGEP